MAKKKRAKINEIDKAQAIASVLNGITMEEVAKAFNVDKSTISRWVSSYKELLIQEEETSGTSETETPEDTLKPLMQQTPNIQCNNATSIATFVANPTSITDKRNIKKLSLCEIVALASNQLTEDAIKDNELARQLIRDKMPEATFKDLVSFYDKTSQIIRLDAGKSTANVQIKSFNDFEEYD